MVTCSKTLQIPIKNASCMHMASSILTSQKKNSNFLKQESEKDPTNLQIVNLLHEKRTWPFKKLHGKQKVAHASRTFSNNRNNITIEMNNCIGFLNFKVHQTCTGTPKKTQVLNFKLHQASTKKTQVLKTCTGTQKNKSFELQSAPNLHRDKKQKKLSNLLGKGQVSL